MTLNRLMIILGILVVFAGVGIAWLWQYAYSPEGRALVIIAQLKGETTSLRGWMLQHHLIRPGVPQATLDQQPLDIEAIVCPEVPASEEMFKLGPKVLPIVIEALRDENWGVRSMAALSCGKFRDPSAIQPLIECIRNEPHKPHDLRIRLDLSYPAGQSGVNVQSCCVDSLIEIGPKAISGLLRALKDIQARKNSRTLVAAALARMENDDGLNYLLAMLKSSDVDDRAYAAFQLGEVGKTHFKGSPAPLIALLNDSDPKVRIMALQALWELYVHDPVAIAAIRKLLNDPDAQVRSDAAAALDKLGVKPPPASQPGK